MSEPTSQKKKSNKGLIAIIIILLLAIGGLGYMLMEKDKEVKDASAELELIQSNLEQSLADIRGLESNNDSMDAYIVEREARLLSMIDSVAKAKEVTDRQLSRWRNEAVSKRKEVDRLTAVVDSVNKAYGILQIENDSLNVNLDAERHRSEELTNQARELQNEVEVGSQLQLTSINAGAYKVYSSGEEDETERARRAERVKACFTIGANAIAEKGERQVYMRVLTPELKVVVNQSDSVATNKFMVQGNELFFTASKSVWYENTDQNVCLSYDKEDWVKGTYTVEIYIGDAKVQEARFVLD